MNSSRGWRNGRGSHEESSPLRHALSNIIQTYRQRDEGDTIFIEYIGVEGSLRLALPAVVSDVIARQRDALTGKSRSKAAKANAMDRKARGIEPKFKWNRCQPTR